ncbi:MAG: penicillin-binding protein 2 [Candidatus Nealsonbacteria bacterium CG23_combo_of_CG06-09_8_20_14_all_37_18]|uniref:Penicillin-binding protein 2 n=1 Tax=Candidatus Nealsonbacteria bacterium CG23_combo_of_CG06-09_8_20_14_all_37_18 TaxID=1974720 RepID=A0A2G9YY04_9BACT|nr:MAG: penicillin-binding protein 2 [Candidatus Nealsonbacteria bacterium CG23_combo_of_CG06-09_8_20_14_all_37_18]
MLGFPSFKKFKKRRIELAFKEDIEPHEILLDSLAEKKEKQFGFSEKKFEVPLLKKIIQGFFVFCFFIILILLFRTFQLQVVEGKIFTQLAERNKFIIHQIQAERGVIYDKNLNQLVFNQLSFDLICQKNNLPQQDSDKEGIIKEVSDIVKRDLKKEIEESTSTQILISENLDHQTLILLETKIKELPGFSIKNNAIREYKDGEAFSHIIGYTNKIKSEEIDEAPEFYSINDYVGRTGIENFYEEVLRKNPGKLRIERNAQGNVISQEIISLPESGKSLVLWLDSDLQKKIKEELEKELKIVGAKRAVGVALDSKTGGVLALVSLPDFDNNLFQKGADPEKLQELLDDPFNLQPLFNRAIAGKYLTGSAIKPLIASAALEENIISPEKKLNCEGKIIIPNIWDPASPTIKKDWTTHGWTNLRKALAESCNVYFYTVGGGYGDQKGLGPTKIKEYLELFGWDGKTGIDLPGEAEGFIPDKEWKKKVWGNDWWDGDTYNLSIGQGFLQITPMEVINSFAAIANGGTLYKPQIAKEIIDTSTGSAQVGEEDKSSSSPFAAARVVEEFKPEIIRQNFIDSQNLQIVREGMRQAVSGENSPLASAVILNSLPVAVAAKTGTAELGGDRYNNWVTIFAPYEDPEIVLTIMIENVKGVQAAALPVAKAVLEWYFTK